MENPKSTKVFLSYAHKDGAELVRRLHDDLSGQGYRVWLDTQRLDGGDLWSNAIECEIDQADIVLALLSHGSYLSEICRGEQLRSLRKGKCVIPLLVQSDCEVPIYLESRQWLDFSSCVSFELECQKLIVAIERHDGAVLKPEYRITYNNAPGLLENLVRRPEVLEALRAKLFAHGANRNIALTAVDGMGGIGKTVLAQELCHDDAVQQAFPDGVFWFTIGKESRLDFVSQVKGVPGLNRFLGEYEGEEACLSQYREVLRRKAALIVLDDVWRAKDVKPFYAESPRSRVLFTTRDESIATSFGAREFKAELLTKEQSLEALARWSGWRDGPLPAEADNIIQECGHLPLALSMVGASLHGEPPASWKVVASRLRQADLGVIGGDVGDYQHNSFLRAIQVSIEELEKKNSQDKERYLALAVLLDDMEAPVPILRTLWCLGDFDARRVAKRFVDLSLAQRGGADRGISLHDLQLDYVRTQHGDRETLDLIHGAVRLSSNAIGRDPAQFASQMLGRLLPHQGVPAIKQFTARLVEGVPKPWLRPLQSALHPPGTSLVRTLEGHSRSVNGVAMSADGRRAVSASVDKTLKVWDLETGRELRILEGHSNWVNCVAVSPDGRRVVSASRDTTLKVWDLETGRELRTLEGHSSSVNGVAMTADGQRAVSASRDKTLKVWDLETGRELRTLEGHADAVYGVAVSADGRRAISASRDKTLKVWDLETLRELRTLEGHSDSVFGVVVSADGQRAVSASYDKTLKVWDLKTGRELRTLEGHSNIVAGVAVSADQRLAVSASHDRTLKVWNLETGRELRTLEGHSGSVAGVAVSADGRRAVSASEDNTLKVWDPGAGKALRTIESHSDSVFGVAVSADSRRAVSASWDKTLKVWDLETGRALRTLQSHSNRVSGVAVSANGGRAISASYDKTLKVWDLESGCALRTLEGHSDSVSGVAMSADGRLAVSTSWDRTLKVWDLESGRPVHTLEGHSAPVSGVAMSADGQRAISASRDTTLKVWDLGSGRLVRTLEGHSAPVSGVAVTADGRRAVSASLDTTLRVWDLETSDELRTMEGHSDWVNGVAVSADGRRAISASRDKTLKVWDLDVRMPCATFTCDDAVLSCVFIGNDKLFAGDYGGRVHFLSLEEPIRKD